MAEKEGVMSICVPEPQKVIDNALRDIKTAQLKQDIKLLLTEYTTIGISKPLSKNELGRRIGHTGAYVIGLLKGSAMPKTEEALKDLHAKLILIKSGDTNGAIN